MPRGRYGTIAISTREGIRFNLFLLSLAIVTSFPVAIAEAIAVSADISIAAVTPVAKIVTIAVDAVARAAAVVFAMTVTGHYRRCLDIIWFFRN